MTRRKRSPSPSPPRKRVAFEIPNSLQQLSALSRTLAQQADFLAGVDKDEKNARTIVQAQALVQTPLPPADQLQSRFQVEKPRTVTFQKFVTQKQEFPEAQRWVQTQRPQRPPRNLPATYTPDSRSVASLPTSPGPPSRPPQTPVPQVMPPPIRLAQAETLNEPPAREGEPLCLSTQPHQIAALIARKLAENEASRRREKWAQEQFAHRISKAADDQLMKELRNELNQRSKPIRQEEAAATEARRDGIEQLKDYINNGKVVPADEMSEEVTSTSIRRSQDHDFLFSSTATSPVVEIVEKTPQSRSNVGSGPQPRSAGEAQTNAVRTQLIAAASSSVPATRQKAQPQVQLQYPQTSSSLRQPAVQQRQPAERQSHSFPPTNHLPARPGYYRIDPLLWNNASDILNSFQQLPYSPSIATTGRGYPSSNVRHDHFGRYNGNG